VDDDDEVIFGVRQKPNSRSCWSWSICFSTYERTWAIGVSLRNCCFVLLSILEFPCNNESTDDNGGGGWSTMIWARKIRY
jgi:hypothetical protein